MVSEEELKRKYNLFTDCWRFCKKYADVQDADEYWENVVSEAAAINQTYHCPLCKDLILAILNELERKEKEIGVNAEYSKEYI